MKTTRKGLVYIGIGLTGCPIWSRTRERCQAWSCGSVIKTTPGRLQFYVVAIVPAPDGSNCFRVMLWSQARKRHLVVIHRFDDWKNQKGIGYGK